MNEYTINGKAFTYCVPAVGVIPAVLYTSCNGFDTGTTEKANQKGVTISNTWQNIYKVHSNSPFHVGLGGGDQLYCDEVLKLPLIKKWLVSHRSSLVQHPFTPEMESAVGEFYLHNYLQMFSNTDFNKVLSSIPHIMQWVLLVCYITRSLFTKSEL